jgi:hypothetical protein
MVGNWFDCAVDVYPVPGGAMSNHKTLILQALRQVEQVLTTLQCVYEVRLIDTQDDALDHAYTLCNNLYDSINNLDN